MRGIPGWRDSREWRNRQTRWLQVPVPERAWGFNSPLAHHRRLTAIAPVLQGEEQVSYGSIREQVTLRGGLFCCMRPSAGVLGFGCVLRRFKAVTGLQHGPAALSGQ